MRPKPHRVLRLRQLRRLRELTLEQTAAKVGLTLNAYHAIETGKSTPTLDTAQRIATFFGQPIERVFELVEVPQ